MEGAEGAKGAARVRGCPGSSQNRGGAGRASSRLTGPLLPTALTGPAGSGPLHAARTWLDAASRLPGIRRGHGRASRGPEDGGARENRRRTTREPGTGRTGTMAAASRHLRDAALTGPERPESMSGVTLGAGCGRGTPTQSDCSGTTVRAGVWHVGWERR